jgi:hypothetical protein
LFKYDGSFFTNVKNSKVLDVQGGKDAEATNVQVWGKNGTPAQRWKVVYTDNMGDEAYQTKGTDKRFNFRVGEIFYLRSKMPMQRVMEAVGANNVVLKRWVRNRIAQQFYFDGVSKTIKSKQWTGYSMDMQGNNLRLRSTNSRWF